MAERRGNGEEEKRKMQMGGGAQAPVSAAELMHSLKGIHFPADRADLEAQARTNNAQQGVIQWLQRMPERQYHNPTEVEHEFSRIK